MIFESEVALISVGLFLFSVLTPFADITKLRKMFEKLGDYDSVSFGFLYFALKAVK